MVDAECLPDTIRIEKEIFVPKVVYQEKTSTFDLVKLILVLLLIISLIAYFSKLFKNN
jgi:flagellar biogenesis protein FliO